MSTMCTRRIRVNQIYLPYYDRDDKTTLEDVAVSGRTLFNNYNTYIPAEISEA